jgi:hypothetical protein
MFEDWGPPVDTGSIYGYSHTEILTQYGVKVRCMLDTFYMSIALYTNRGKQMYDKPTLNGQLLTREEFSKFQYYGFHRSMILCDNPQSLVIWLSSRVKDSNFPGQTVCIVMQHVEMKRNADGDIDFVGTCRLRQRPRF